MPSHHEKDQIRQCMRALRESLPGFRSRRSQLQMVGAVANALGHCREPEEPPGTGAHIALCQCGTGTGKSIAAAVPALVMAKSRSKPLVISTSTIALQHQYSDKDIPTLQRLLPISFSFAVAKGRRRYACTAKLFASLDDTRQMRLATDECIDTDSAAEETSERTALRELIRLAEAFDSGRWNGDRDQLKSPVSDELWSQITTDRQGCAGSRCPQFAKCPFYAARQRLKEADLIIANHDLVLASLQMNGHSVLPEPEETFYVFDEGHSLPNKVVEQFASKHALRGSIEWLRGLADCIRDIVLGLQLDHDVHREVRTESKGLSVELEALHQALERTGAFEAKPVRRFKNGVIPDWTRDPGINIFNCGAKLQRAIGLVREQMFEKSNADPMLVTRLIAELGFFASKLDNLVDTWTLMLAQDSERGAPNARWIERTGEQGSHDYVICASPISGAAKLRELLWKRASAAIVTSATLASCNSFRPYLRQCGLSPFPDVRTLKVDSPFDYRNNARLILPAMRSDPKDAQAHTDEIVELLPKILRGRGSLVLFASARQMRAVQQRLPEDVKSRVLMQGDMPKREMLARHRAAIDNGEASILFGLSSLAEGVDLPGEFCTHVVVAKVPFSVPESPLEEARSEWIISLGRSPFVEIVLPEASIRLEQAVGRLLRTVTDQGIVTILDRRLTTKAWGAVLLKGLPAFTVLAGKAANDAIATLAQRGNRALFGAVADMQQAQGQGHR